MKYIYYETIDSTNSELKRRLDDEKRPDDFTVISAGLQTAGRGRSGHDWASLPGVSVSTSMIIYPQGVCDRRIPQLTIVAAMAAAQAVEGLFGLRVQIKWPNDVLLNRKKFCGILTERIKDAVIIGIGVNVYRESYPASLNERATSLEEEMAVGSGRDLSDRLHTAKSKHDNEWGVEPADGHVLSRRALTEKIWENFVFLYQLFLKENDLSFLADEYNARLVNAGAMVQIMQQPDCFEAVAKEMDGEGRLVVTKVKTGEIIRIDSGEVHVRGMDGYV